MTINQLSVFIENKRGRLAEITNVLKQNNVDIRALSIADTKEFGILRLIVSDAGKGGRGAQSRWLYGSADAGCGNWH